MPLMTISLDGVVLKDIELKQPRTTLGRRPYNDIVIDNLAVSGEHMVFVLHSSGVEVIDLNSTNGTYLNGKAIVSALVRADDVIEIGRYQMRIRPDAPAGHLLPLSPPRIRVLSGPATGKEVTLTKPITTLGKPGISVAAIHMNPDGCTFCLVDGQTAPLLNGKAVGQEAVPLQHKDLISIASTDMCFFQGEKE